MDNVGRVATSNFEVAPVFETAEEAYEDILREARESGVNPAALMRTLPEGTVSGADPELQLAKGVTAGTPRNAPPPVDSEINDEH